ncbi:tetratricopeptide repeat protein [Chitinophaga sp. 180180018-2]|nr:tetratricopeptide repeat protein [Chitinophaga sp. 212800010-3]
MTGLNFSVQLKSTGASKKENTISATLKHSTVSYYFSRLEPVMIIIYDLEDDEAYWSWIHELNIDLTKSNETYTASISKNKRISAIDWDDIINFIQEIFNRRSFIEYLDIKTLSATQIAAWKAFYSGAYEQAIFLFKQLQKEEDDVNITQAIAWSHYLIHNYKEALLTINRLLNLVQTDYILQVKACILTEFGIRTGDKGMILSGKMIFEKYISSNSDALQLYNYANALGSLGDDTRAAEYYNLSLSKNPNSAECWKNLGSIYWNLGQHDDEIKCYDNALAINPTLREALFSKGVTLSKVYGKHEEALNLFSSLIKNEETLLNGFPKGYYWIAYVFEKVGNIIESLKWINKGLDFIPTEISLLNLKSNLVVQHFQDYPSLKDEAIAFLKYRIDLQNDSLSIYHYIKIRQLNEHESFSLIKERFPAIIKVSIEEYQDLGFSANDLLDGLINMNAFLEFSGKYPSDRYINHLINKHYSVEAMFWNCLEIIRLISFTKIIDSDKNGDFVLNIPRCCDVFSNSYPYLLDVLIPSNSFPNDVAKEILVFIMENYPVVAYREIGAQIGHVGSRLSLDVTDQESNLTEEWTEEFEDKIFFVANEILQIKN